MLSGPGARARGPTQVHSRHHRLGMHEEATGAEGAVQWQRQGTRGTMVARRKHPLSRHSPLAAWLLGRRGLPHRQTSSSASGSVQASPGETSSAEAPIRLQALW